jgi:uncharacterized protein (TIGR02598 family)
LVEVAIAVGILAVVLVALLGLMPVGMTNFRKAMDTSVTAQIAQRILLDMQQADFNQTIDAADASTGQSSSFTFTAPLIGSRQFRFFDAQGVEIVTQDGTANSMTLAQKNLMVYQVVVRVMPTASMPADPATIHGSVALVTVQVARNPNNRNLSVLSGSDSDPTVPNRNLFDPNPQVNPGLQVFTYSALIGKNQG